jgi:hypothetical protein
MNCLQRPRIQLDEECLRWTPLVPPPGIVIPEDLYTFDNYMPMPENQEVINENTPKSIDLLKKRRKRRWYKAYHKRKRRRISQKTGETSIIHDENGHLDQKDNDEDSLLAPASQLSQDDDNSATEEETEEEIMKCFQKESPINEESSEHVDDCLGDVSNKSDVNVEQQSLINNNNNNNNTDDISENVEQVINVSKADTIESNCDNNNNKDNYNKSVLSIGKIEEDNVTNKISDSNSTKESEQLVTQQNSDNVMETDQTNDSEERLEQWGDNSKSKAIPKKRWQKAVIDLNGESSEESNGNNFDEKELEKDQQSQTQICNNQLPVIDQVMLNIYK